MEWALGAGWLITAIDVVIVAYLVYRCLLLIRGTRAAPMLLALTGLVLIYFLARWVGFLTVGWILGHFLSSIILVVVIIFQDEIRRGLTKMGAKQFWASTRAAVYDKTIEDLTLVCTRLSRQKIGAIIVIQRDVGLDDFVEDAVVVDALLNRKLLIAIFQKDSPLHDGAVLVDRGRLRAAGCVLPLSYNPDLDPSLGTRHRAALGLSECSDAVIIVVSEENGAISIARDGKLVRNLDAAMLRDSLHRFLGTVDLFDSDEVTV